MSSILKIIAALYIAFCFSSCVSTHITSFRDPFYKDTTGFRVVVVKAIWHDVSVMMQFESQFADYLNETGWEALPHYKLLPPVRDYTTAEVSKVLKQNKVEAIIYITPTGIDFNKIVVPSYSKTALNTMKTGSETVTYPSTERVTSVKVNTEVVVCDLETGNNIWKGFITTDMAAISADNIILMRSIIEATTQRMYEENVLNKSLLIIR